MPKKIYCSKCGNELKHYRKALPGKPTILDVVDPHNCKGYVVEESDKPTLLDLINEVKELYKSKPVETTEKEPPPPKWFSNVEDRRSDIRTTAPRGILEALGKEDM